MPKISATAGPTMYDPSGEVAADEVAAQPPAAAPSGSAASAVTDDGPVDVDGDGQITSYELFTKPDLIAHIEGLNENRAVDDQLSTAGNKPDLVRRIQEAEAAAAKPAGAGA